MAGLFAGTSGFAYPNWKPAFYPANVPATGFLAHYAKRLNSVEINYTFRRLPAATTLQSWVEATSPGFLFAVKAHMKITHVLRLKNAAEFTEIFFRAIDPLRSTRRLGPVLFQLPPQMKCDLAALSEFLGLLPADARCAFEFRHASWLADGIYDALRKHNACLCLAESDKFETPEVLTADFVYGRLRRSDYSAAERAQVREKAETLLAEGRDVFLYFKHEETPDGALHAEELLGGAGPSACLAG